MESWQCNIPLMMEGHGNIVP